MTDRRRNIVLSFILYALLLYIADRVIEQLG